MTLDVTKPNDANLISELAYYLRETRTAVNAISGSGNVGVTDLTIDVGTTSLTVGTELGEYGFEVVKVTGDGASTLTTIIGGTEGMVKVFIFSDANVKMTDGVASGGKFYLNQLPALSDFEPTAGTILALVNIDGDGGTTYGYWKELYRTEIVK